MNAWKHYADVPRMPFFKHLKPVYQVLCPKLRIFLEIDGRATQIHVDWQILNGRRFARVFNAPLRQRVIQGLVI